MKPTFLRLKKKKKEKKFGVFFLFFFFYNTQITFCRTSEGLISEFNELIKLLDDFSVLGKKKVSFKTFLLWLEDYPLPYKLYATSAPGSALR